MSENIPNALERIRCWHCKGYLSCAPICSLRNGNLTCGLCTPLNDGTPSYRVLALENALSDTLFPCRFAQNGCAEKVLFDKAIDHELSCMYRTFICPTAPQIGCKWEGSSLQMLEHFEETHPELILDNMELTLETEENKEGILVTVKDGVVFIVKFKYDGNQKVLTYKLRHCNNETNNVSYRIQLFNDSDYSGYLKPIKALLYDGDFSDMHNALLSLNGFLQMAEYPNSVKIIFYLKVTREVDNIVDYKLLNSIRCYKCRHYLVHPIFDLNNHTICSICVEKNDECAPSTNAEIKELIAKANYPCRWRECTFIGKSDNIKMHELTCEFRFYECSFIGCDAAFKLNEAVKHFEGHKCEYNVDKISYKTSFEQDYKYKHVFHIFNKNLIVIEYSMVNSSENEKQHVVEVEVATLKSVKILAVVEFEHQHCKIKSDGFVLKTDEKLIVTAKELPSCFKNSEELTVSVEIVDVIPN